MRVTARLKAMDYLARREHSLVELRRKLLDKGFEPLEVASSLKALKEEGLQSDQRLCEAYIRYRVGMGFGRLHILKMLHAKGVATDTINAAFKLADVDWGKVLKRVWLKKFSQQAVGSCNYLKQQRFLIQRGFEYPLVTHFLKML